MQLFNFGVYSIMEPRYSISNITVKRYCGENTSGAVLWENSTMPKFFIEHIFLVLIHIYFQYNTFSWQNFEIDKGGFHNNNDSLLATNVVSTLWTISAKKSYEKCQVLRLQKLL